MLIITGSPRSGTTRLAAFLQMMGQGIQGLWIPGQCAGGLEDENVRRINKPRLLESGRSEEVDRAIREFPQTVVKEPRFASLARPELIRAWNELRPDIRFSC